MTTDTELILIAAIPSVLAAVLAFLGVLLTISNNSKIAATQNKISAIEVHINGHIDKVLGITEKLADGIVNKEGKDG